MRTLRWMWIAGLALAWTGAATATAAAPTSSDQIVIFRLDGALPEAPPEFELFTMEPNKSLHEILERCRKAKKDESVKAVVLMFEEPEIGFAQLQELRQAVAELRAADKDVFAYFEQGGSGVYQLAAAATKVIMPPTGDLQLMGIHSESPYFKALLDKIHVEADIEHIGAYKSAGEPYTRTEPSKEAAEMTEWLLKDLFDQIVQNIADSRQLTPERVRELIDDGPYTAKRALEVKLIDETAYVEEFTRSLRKRFGEETKVVYNYGAKKGPELDLSNPFAIFKLFGEGLQQKKGGSKPSIGVVYVDGMILTGRTEEGLFGSSGTVGSTTLRRTLNKARDDDSIKAVVLRVDSPGGSALASDIIWHATKELADKKPLVVSMGDVAASGGYYVSVGAGTIFADPGTITGSIGVVGGKIVTKGLWDWAGINWHEHNFGKNAELMSTNRKWNERERAIIRKYMEDVYGEFKDRVTKGRGERIKKDLEELAGGRVYTGKQALGLGLVDRLGGLQDAIKFAAAAGNISDYEIRLLPERKNLIDMILKSLMGGESDEDAVAIKAGAPRFGWTLQSPAIREIIPALRTMDRTKADSILHALLRIELLAQEPALLVTPTDITVR